ncbi:MAG: DUF1569 domain-containing protein [Lewinellaceae bacterium]|nr:DUF1569 domain-containing protein [Lewinellaceae bacterium]
MKDLAYAGIDLHQPDFAYGSLTKKQYERANAMYIGNHLSALEY